MKSLINPHVKLELVDRIVHLQPDAPRRWGRMDAAQMICHLSDSFLAVMGEHPLAIDPHFRARTLVKWLALYFPRPWPSGVPTRPEIDQLIGGTPPSDFEADRRRLLAAIDRFTRHPRDFSFQPHPMFLQMSEREWMRWGYLHTDHHLRQFGC